MPNLASPPIPRRIMIFPLSIQVQNHALLWCVESPELIHYHLIKTVVK